MLENTEGAITNGQSRDTLNVGHRTEEEVKQNKNTRQYVLDPTIISTNNIEKTEALLQPTGGDDEPNIVSRPKS